MRTEIQKSSSLDRAAELAERILGIHLSGSAEQAEYIPNADAWYIHNDKAEGSDIVVWDSGFMVGTQSSFSFQRKLQILYGVE